MENTDLQFVATLAQAILMLLLPVLVGAGVRWVLAMTKAEIARLDNQTLSTITWLATVAVQAAEQAKVAGYIADKKAYAIDFCQKWLKRNNLNIDLSLISSAIEAAVLEQFNKPRKSNK